MKKNILRNIISFYILLTICFLSISCSNESTNSENLNENFLNDFMTTDDSSILGNWTMCSFICGGEMVQANVCQTIHFNYNGTGFVSKSDINLERFIWKLKNGKLSISNIVQNTNNTFLDTTFETRFGKKDNNHFLTIINKSKECQYYLSN